MTENNINNQPTNKKPNITSNAQYVKDLSFENPNAPASLANLKQSPSINVNVDIQVNKLDDTIFEVSLIITAKAKSAKEDIFIVELSYAGVFTVNVSDGERNLALMIYCPSLLFPFARSIIASTTRDGGFPPLMLEPIDFAVLYKNHQQSMVNQAPSSEETH